MNALRLSLLALTLLLFSNAAAAQRRNTIGFETDCNGATTPGVFVGGYKEVNDDLYKSCGLASVNSGGATGKQQLAQSGTLPVIGTIGGVTGQVALAGAYNISTFSTLTIVFSIPVNEVSFDALDLDNKSGLRVELDGVDGAPVVVPATPIADANKVVHYSQTSAAPILRLVVSYVPSPSIPIIGGLIGDGWFLDQLSFNAWKCGDGEIDSLGGEACDDGNPAQCDGCGNTCQATTIGCISGMSCVAPGTTAGCLICSLSTPIGPSGDRPTTPGPTGTACDDGLFCTLPGACDAAGSCQSPANNCSDGIVCTQDTCDESTDQCLHPIEDKWCLIGGTCFSNGAGNPANVCERCTAAKSNTAWDAQALGTQCGDPACANGSSTAASTCNGSGQCAAGASQTCMFMMCANAQSCDGRCMGDQQCAQPAYCDPISTSCVADLPQGSACTRDAQCSTKACADGVCCDNVCNGACESCNQERKVGTCSPLPAMAIDPQGLCGTNQFCSASGVCTNPPPPTPPPVTPPVTPPVDARPMGTGCETNAVCGSGVCKDGVCCDRACEDLCESCNVPGQPPGQCRPFALGEDPENECAGSGG
ncbi:MAG: Flagellar hook-length control protein FliK, partial [Myxococcaceae bacterium]|nr:Flagellar hook-length control protein FliK [Myxococcaceae bacterium]